MALMLHNNTQMVLREEGDEGAMLFDPDTGAVLLLNSTATVIYKLFDVWRTQASLIDVLKKTYDHFGAAEESRVNVFIETLGHAGALSSRTGDQHAGSDADT